MSLLWQTAILKTASISARHILMYFFRNVPDNGGFAIAAGLDQIIEYIKELHFSAEDIEFLRSKEDFR